MILDASALLAWVQNETGGDRVEMVLPRSSISTVNWSEVVQKLMRHDSGAADIRFGLEDMGMKIIPFSVEQAEICASLWLPSMSLGLSLADRVCLQLGMTTEKTVLTADRTWSNLDIPGINVEQIR